MAAYAARICRIKAQCNKYIISHFFALSTKSYNYFRIYTRNFGGWGIDKKGKNAIMCIGDWIYSCSINIINYF